MLVRIWCDPCRLCALWTDDPRRFFDTACMHYRELQGAALGRGLVEESGRERGEMPSAAFAAYKR